ncbi:hypothetical protein ACJMK2_033753 [Sinanodonta woodiana]|uniref:Uncharacterized protein n=1 Tax=Sinanodonta woodiana TaxID=1069815 RepID=A0ABD3WSW0_SINWO
MVSNHVDKMKKMQEVVDDIGTVEEMLMRLEDGYGYTHHCQMEINNISKATERLRDVLNDANKDKEDKERRK